LSSEEARCFEFIICIDEDPLDIKRLPDKFTEFVDGAELAELQQMRLLSVACRDLVRRAGQDVHATGWEKFAHAHNLEAGCLFTFLYEGDVEMIVNVFNKTSCRRHYHTDESGENTDI
jgi:hypothetical protein